MKTEYDFIFIEKEHLKTKTTFPFHLYIYNPHTQKYYLFLNGNKPFTKEIEDLLSQFIQNGAKLAIQKKQKRTFLHSQSLKEEDIGIEDFSALHEMEKDRLIYIKQKESYVEKNGLFSLTKTLDKALENDDFIPLISYAQLEIMTFSVSLNSTVSLAIHFAKHLLNQDNLVNRIVATCFLVSKENNIDKTETLAEIVCASFLANIGYLHLPLKMINASQSSYTVKERKLFEKHTILSNHLIKKSHIILSERAKKIIHDHHENLPGHGYPLSKQGESIDQLALLIGAISQIFEYSAGKIDGEKHSLRSIIVSIRDGHFISTNHYGQEIVDQIQNLIPADTIFEKKIA